MIYRAIFFALGCAFFVFLFARLGAAEIWALLARIGWRLALIAVAYVGHQLIRTAALWRCVETYGSMPYRDLVRIRLSGEAVQQLTFMGPFLSEPAKALLLKERGLTAHRAFAAVIAEYLIYTFAAAIMAVAALLYILRSFELSPAFAVGARIALCAAGAFLAAAAFAILLRFYLIGMILGWVAALPLIGKRLRIDPKALRDTEDLLFVILRDRFRRFLSVFGIEFLAQGPLLLELYILLTASGQSFRLIDPLLIEASTKYLSAAFFFLPGQVGASEGLYVAVFDAIGLPASAGFGLALARRVRTLLVAGIGLAFLSFHKGRGRGDER